MSEIGDYIHHGWKICRIPHGSKGPTDPDWINNPIPTHQPGWNHGLIHQASGTMALDIDNMEEAQTLLMTRGIDLVEILSRFETVLIDSGNPGHEKALYAMPFPLPSKKIIKDKKDIINFRCIGCQDVLPPSIHPSGSTYRWLGDWRNLPTLPPELMEVWSELLSPPATAPATVSAEDTDLIKIKAALAKADPDCDRITWVEIGMALHSVNPDLFPVWDEWSSKGKKYNASEMAGQWRSFKNRPDGITIHTLYHHARKQGWKPDLELAKAMFKTGVKITNTTDFLVQGVAVPPLPLDCLPDLVGEYCHEVAERVGANHAVPVSAALVAICAVADARSRLWMGEQYAVPPVLWCATVGPPSSKKSPATAPMFDPLLKIEAEDRPRFQAAMLIWEGQEAKHLESKKEYLGASRNLSALPNTVLPTVFDLPPAPVPLRFVISDATSQKVVRLLQDRPQGMACFLDEGSGWLARVTNPKSGEDRGCWVSAYESRPYHYDRVGSGSIFLDNMALAMHMNVQPAIVRQYVSTMQADGMAQRFAPFVIPADEASFVSNPSPKWLSLAPAWEHKLRSIYAAGKHDYHLCDEGKKIVREFEKRLEKKKRIEAMAHAGEGFQSAIGKLMGLFGRFILVFHLAEDATIQTVPVEIVKNAERFIEDYFVFVIEQFHTPDESFDQWVFDWLVTGDEDFVNGSDIRRAARRQLEGRSLYEQREIVAMTASFLERLGVIIEIEGDSRSSTYAINPDIRDRYKDRRLEVSLAKQAKLDRSRDAMGKVGVVTKKRFARGISPEMKN